MQGKGGRGGTDDDHLAAGLDQVEVVVQLVGGGHRVDDGVKGELRLGGRGGSGGGSLELVGRRGVEW